MARRGSELTVPTEEALLVAPKAITRKKSQAITPTNAANALAIEQLEITFDDDLRLAIIEGLVSQKQLILQETAREHRIAKALEIARLQAVQNARDVELIRVQKLEDVFTLQEINLEIRLNGVLRHFRVCDSPDWVEISQDTPWIEYQRCDSLICVR